MKKLLAELIYHSFLRLFYVKSLLYLPPSDWNEQD
jgi:hypothetical protein